MSEKEHELELTDEQREEVRSLLSKFGGKKTKEKNAAKFEEAKKSDPDPLEESARPSSGTN